MQAGSAHHPKTARFGAPGAVVRQGQLPPALQEQLGQLRAQHSQKRYRPHAGGSRFEDGSLWFANGHEVQLDITDHLADAVPGLGIFALLATGAYTYYLFDTSSGFRWIGAGVTAVVLVGLIGALWWHRARASRAVGRMDLGTLLLENSLVIVSHGRYVLFDRRALVEHDVVRRGTDNAPQVHVVRYRGAAKDDVQELTGFAHNPEAVAELKRWLDS